MRTRNKTMFWRRGQAVACTALALLALAGPATAKELDDGKAALGRKEFTLAAQKFAAGFDSGDAEAGFYLARMIELGVGFAADPVKARALYVASAAKGSPAAMNRLGLMHLRGESVRQDYAAAAELICKAADLGDTDALFNCAGLALEGTGRAKDAKVAYGFYDKAAKAGHTGARNMAAVLLRSGNGIDKDAAKAADYFEKGAAAGNPVALFSLAEMLEKGEGRAADPVSAHLYYNLANERSHPAARAALDRLGATLTAEQIAQAQTRARNWKPSLATEDN